MSLVLDSSVALAWIFTDERSDATQEVLDLVTGSGAWVPSIWRLEVANSLQQGVRHGRLSSIERDASLADLAILDIAVDPETAAHAWSTTLELAERFGLTVYDAAYLDLAHRRRLPLATLDVELRSAGKNLGVRLLAPQS